ncbi:MAG: ABC transporter ATP-binding protein [Bacteriovoracaceae bacterium]|nr:ABC transporter ATP-binding protein [Bacteriovoracaceae bacterium]
MQDTLINIHNLSKHYSIGGGQFSALKNVDLKINAGDFMGLVGPSGSGKTTLLNVIGALDSPSEGSVEVLKLKIENISAKQAAKLRKEKLGFIFQTYNLLPVYNVYENIEFPLLLLQLSSTQRKDLVMQALEWVGLLDKVKSKPAQLSGGECQRVAIARAMVKKPQVVLADEPTANLDARNSHNILQTMEKLNQLLGTTFIFATHDAKVIGYLKRKVTLIDGRVEEDITLPPRGPQC